MNHYCNKISQNLRSIFAVSKKLPESITLAKIHPVGQIKSQLEKLQEKHYEILHERNFGEREKLARKIGAECVDNFHEGVAWATWREKDGTKVLRLIKQSGEWVASPSLSPFGYRNIHDYTPVKNGVTWLFRHTRSGENEITAYVIDIKHGSSYKPEYKEVDLSHFTSDNLVYLRHYSSADNRNYSFFIKGYGEILKEKGFEGELFDEACPFDKTGHAWVRNGKNIRLINTKGEATGETNQPYLQQVLPMNEGLFWVKLAVSPAMHGRRNSQLYPK